MNIQKSHAENLRNYFSHLIVLYEKLIRNEIRIADQEIKLGVAKKTSLLASEAPPQMIWNQKLSAIMELVIALLESNSLIHPDGRKPKQNEAISFFEQVFQIDIKDPRGALHRAANRKKDVVPFLRELMDAFQKYSGRTDR